jgi:ABC-2 type transport system ATP-binding protein
MNPVISVNNLEKVFKVPIHHRGAFGALRNLFSTKYTLVRAVNGISFDIERGELVGYLGPNGAGKSTTMKMLTGLLTPTAGEIQVKGYVPWRQRQEYVSNIGAVFGQRTTLWWDLPVIESLDMLQHIYRIHPNRYYQNLSDFRKLLELDPFLNTPVRSLSLGQRMRADICAALMHDPDLLFLDEPTIGLDVVAKERIRQFILHVNRQRGTTIILTTHDLSDVEKLCERVMIIDQGRLLYDGGLGALRDRFGGEWRLQVDFAEEYPDVSVERARVIAHDGLRATYAYRREEVSASALINAISASYRIRDLSVQEPDIEDTVRRIYEERLLIND